MLQMQELKTAESDDNNSVIASMFTLWRTNT